MKLSGLDPQAYLRQLIQRITDDLEIVDHSILRQLDRKRIAATSRMQGVTGWVQ